ncbi:MAG: hypothetical protein KAW84_06605 [Thermoplasmata archaeon]|nr:hypothetical protein [Thermoplasmata archaeon]
MHRHESVTDYRTEDLMHATYGIVPGKDTKGRYLISRMNITGFYIMTMFLVGFLAMMLFYAQFSGILRWIIVLLLISSMGFGIAYLSSRNTTSPERLSPDHMQRDVQWGEIARLTGILRRAEKNYRYSQLEAVERIRKTVIDRIQSQRDISDEEMGDALQDEERLMELVGDEEVAVFLLASEKDLSNWSSIVREKLPVMSSFRGSRGFNESVLSVLERMEDWQ